MYFRPHGRGFLANNNMGVELTRRRREKITILPSGLHTKTVFLALKNSAEGRKFFEILFSLKRPKMRFSAEGGNFLDLTPFLKYYVREEPIRSGTQYQDFEGYMSLHSTWHHHNSV